MEQSIGAPGDETREARPNARITGWPDESDNDPAPHSGVLLGLVYTAAQAARWHRREVDRLVTIALDEGLDPAHVARAAAGIYP